MSKLDPTTLSNALVEERPLRRALIDGIDGDIISGGLLTTGSAQTPWAESVTQNYVIGSKLRFTDGRVFRYCKAGASALVKGFMCQGPAVVSNYTDQVQTGHGIAVSLSAGNILITTGATPAANLFAQGWLVVNEGTGISQVRKVLTSGSHATIVPVTFTPALEAAIAVTDDCSLIQSPYVATIVMPVTTPTNVPVGIPPIAVTAAYYYWSQTGGPAACIVDTAETILIGQPVGLPGTSSVAGACGVNVTITTRWGPVLYVAAATDAALIDLQLDT